jgi:uncharacterized protein (DUF362 family)
LNPDHEKKGINRRHFLYRSLKSGLAIAGVSAGGYWFYDPIGPLARTNEGGNAFLSDFSVPGVKGKLGVARGPNRVETLNRVLKILGGLERFIQRGDRVLIKVNAAFASSPMLSATTHPDLVFEMARLCYQAGATQVYVADNPINDPASCFALTGIEAAAVKAGAVVILPKAHFFRPISLKNGHLIRHWPIFYEPFKKCNKLIGMAPVKDHHRSGASMIMKNWYGFLGGPRNILHQDIHNTIKELALLFKPTLVVLDGTTSMMTNGPTGGSVSDLKNTNTMIAGTDQVAVDAFGATLLGKDVNGLPFIGKAAAAGVGTADYQTIAGS